ncbi:HAMP domain-containing histidine kinase [Paraburkholderia sp. Ac-20336]|uniref:sensor histidine kinase n=1 Tax=Paraburkholderia sp. Ac-20336 TaxID=2703886 RepID=UPI0019818835|nr:HAMP domain-containing sensor histidine kinase [Paraburkholderia sp. Ac-20336]MBN3803044.1 HAMP domain-containing histidine kinase [Paraburkholderia sp. Ac-20336]
MYKLRLLFRQPSPWLLFCLQVVIAIGLFSLLCWVTIRHSIGEIDEHLFLKVEQIQHLPTNEIPARIAMYTSEDPENRRPFGYFGPGGEHLVGAFETLPGEVDGKPFDYIATLGHHAGAVQRHYRGVVVRLPSGGIFVTARSTDGERHFDKVLLLIAGGSLVFTLVIGMVSGTLLNAVAARRLRDVRRATQRIASGRLDHRLPLSGSGDDIDKITAVVNSMLDEVERLIRDIQGICAGIAHEVRTPMTRMRGTLESTRRRIMSVTEYEQVIDTALQQSDIVMTRFSALLRMAQIGEAAGLARKGPLNLQDVLNDVIDFYEAPAEDLSITLELLPCVPVIVNGEADLLFSAFGNLVENALKFTPPGGAITVALHQRDGKVTIEVRDTGPGIPVAERDLVFQPFYRAEHQTGTTTAGSGIGLSLVAAIARLHNAHVSVREGGPGCCISIVFESEMPVRPTGASREQVDSVKPRFA